MDILGSGMIARSLAPYIREFPDTVVFAQGVANSRIGICDPEGRRERTILDGVLQRCYAENKRIVYFSSGAVYAKSDSPQSENAFLSPGTGYGNHKLLCEDMITSADVPYLILRLGNLVGAQQNPAQLVPSLVAQIKAGHVEVQMRATRDLMDVDDMARILVDLLRTQTERCETLNVATGHSVPVYNITLKLRAELILDTPIWRSDTGDAQAFDITRLRERLPSATFASNYYRRVLAKYVHAEEAQPT